MEILRQRIVAIRNSIRYPRDQRGDDRCWLDYYPLYQLVGAIHEDFKHLPEYEEFMRICTAFYHQRRAERPELSPRIILPTEEWDRDIDRMSKRKLQQEIDKLVETGLKHHRIPILKVNLDNDRELYAVLPEHNHVELDFTLPLEYKFLGEANPCAGCPNFYKSHANCETPKHNLHQWGPCKISV